MSTAGISFGGLSSGIDTQAIISALLAVERRPLNALESQKEDFTKIKSLFGTLQTKLKELQEAADAIKLSPNFLDFKTSTDNENKFLNASASSSAHSGTFDLAVISLAATENRATLGRADKDSTLYSGGLIFDFADGSSSDPIDITGLTLDQISGAINSAANAGVTATVIDTGIGATPFQLVITSESAGADKAFTLSLDLGGDPTTQALVDEINASALPGGAGADAVLTLNGITVVRPTNTISDLIPGITLELRAEAAAVTPPALPESTKLTVTPDASATGKKIQELVDKYNDILDFLEAQTKVDEEGKADSPLFGDSTLRGLRSNLRIVLGNAVTSNDPDFVLLSQVGISADTAGKLTFTQSEFEEALSADALQVRDLFTLSGEGIAIKLTEQIDVYTDFVDGLIKTRQQGLDRRIKDITDQIRRAETRLEEKEKQLTLKFANMEILMSRLQVQGSALSGLPSLTRR